MIRWRTQPFFDEHRKNCWLVLHHWGVEEDYVWFVDHEAAQRCMRWRNEWERLKRDHA